MGSQPVPGSGSLRGQSVGHGQPSLLHTGAYWLLHQLRQTAPRRSRWRTATFETLRRAFLKIAVRIEELKSRIKIALPSAYPYRKAMVSMAGSIAAQGP